MMTPSTDHPRIVRDPAILCSKPTFCGTRISVALIREAIAAGASLDDLLDAYPFLCREDLLACLPRP